MVHRSRDPARRLVGALLALSLLTSACGSDGAEESDGPTTSATSATTTGSTSGTPSPTTTTPKPKKKNVIAWILGLGPGAPDGPPEFTAYRELQQQQCDVVFDRVDELREPARTLYTGAAQACLAALEGRAALWAEAVAAHAVVAARQSDLTCMDRAAFALLDRLVTLHDAHPDRPFARAANGTSKAPPCPRIEGLEPDQGDEGTQVRVSGRHLGGEVVGVSVVDSLGGSLPVDDLAVGDGVLTFTMPEAPPPEASATVCLVIRADPDWSADGAPFTYVSEFVGAATPFDCPPEEQG